MTDSSTTDSSATGSTGGVTVGDGTRTGTGSDSTGPAVDSSAGSEDSSGTSSIPETCGNGVLERDEQCDLGDANSDNSGCTSQCLLAACGDGLLYIGEEGCDDAGESAACNADCTPTACGDGQINATAGEQCDGEAIANGSCDACLVACDPGFRDCNDTLGDGCEGDLSLEAECTACGLSWETVSLDAVDDVSISSSLKAPDNRIACYTKSSGSGSVVGYLGFDTSGVSDSAVIVGVRVYLHHETGFNNPFSDPIAQFVHADANNWTFATTNPGDITPGGPISGTYNVFDIDAYNEFIIDPTAWDYTVDLADDWMTLGIDEISTDYRYVYFYGVDNPINAPYVELDLCQ